MGLFCVIFQYKLFKIDVSVSCSQILSSGIKCRLSGRSLHAGTGWRMLTVKAWFHSTSRPLKRYLNQSECSASWCNSHHPDSWKWTLTNLKANKKSKKKGFYRALPNQKALRLFVSNQMCYTQLPMRLLEGNAFRPSLLKNVPWYHFKGYRLRSDVR